MEAKIVDIPENEYRSIPCPSVTEIIKYAHCGSDWEYERLSRKGVQENAGVLDEDISEAMIIGSLYDQFLTSGQAPKLVIAKAKTTTAKAFYAEARELAETDPDTTLTTERIASRVTGMVNSTLEHPEVMSYIRDSKKQVKVVLYQNDQPILRGMIDLFHEEQNSLADLKTYSRGYDARTVIRKRGYDMQVAAYALLLGLAIGRPITDVRLICISQHFPFDIDPFILLEQQLKEATERFLAIIPRFNNRNPQKRKEWMAI